MFLYIEFLSHADTKFLVLSPIALQQQQQQKERLPITPSVNEFSAL